MSLPCLPGIGLHRALNYGPSRGTGPSRRTVAAAGTVTMHHVWFGTWQVCSHTRTVLKNHERLLHGNSPLLHRAQCHARHCAPRHMPSLHGGATSLSVTSVPFHFMSSCTPYPRMNANVEDCSASSTTTSSRGGKRVVPAEYTKACGAIREERKQAQQLLGKLRNKMKLDFKLHLLVCTIGRSWYCVVFFGQPCFSPGTAQAPTFAEESKPPLH